MKYEFWGNEICCGSYACLNAMKDTRISLKLFEISTSVPFGIKHIRNSTFDHLLTTWCDPNIGIDKAVPLWGYQQKKEQFQNKKDAYSYLKEEVLKNPVVLGPIDMGALVYLPISSVYRRMDHYIVLWGEDGRIFCEDSEGLVDLELTDEQLLHLLSVDKILEARGEVCVRSFFQIQNYDIVEVLEKSMIYAQENWKDAEKAGQGSKAFLDCYVYLATWDVQLWRLSLLYDLNYLIQRKMLQQKLLQELHRYTGMDTQMWKVGVGIVEEQKALLVRMFGELRKNRRIVASDFENIAKLEQRLARTLFFY